MQLDWIDNELSVSESGSVGSSMGLDLPKQKPFGRGATTASAVTQSRGITPIALGVSTTSLVDLSTTSPSGHLSLSPTPPLSRTLVQRKPRTRSIDTDTAYVKPMAPSKKRSISRSPPVLPPMGRMTESTTSTAIEEESKDEKEEEENDNGVDNSSCFEESVEEDSSESVSSVESLFFEHSEEPRHMRQVRFDYWSRKREMRKKRRESRRRRHARARKQRAIARRRYAHMKKRMEALENELNIWKYSQSHALLPAVFDPSTFNPPSVLEIAQLESERSLVPVTMDDSGISHGIGFGGIGMIGIGDDEEKRTSMSMSRMLYETDDAKRALQIYQLAQAQLTRSQSATALLAATGTLPRGLQLRPSHGSGGLLSTPGLTTLATASSLTLRKAGRMEFDVTFFVSQPLLEFRDSDLTIPTLAVTQELKAIKDALKMSKTRTYFVKKFATVENLRMTTTVGSRVIHYAGHGMPKHLLFESSESPGLAHQVLPEMLRALLSAGGSVGFQLVVVSACHGENSAHAFVDAGADHVVCVTREQALTDKCAKDFTHQFYLSLVSGKTVREAFDVAVATIEVKYHKDEFLRDEWKKFRLLPEDASHDVVLFDQLLTSGSGKPGIKDCTAAVTKCNIPQPPQIWVGRYKKVFQLMQSVLECPLSILFGDKGVGKTALMSKACQYLFERRHFPSGVFVFDIYGMLEQNPDLSLSSLVYTLLLRSMSLKQRSLEMTMDMRKMNTDHLCRVINNVTERADSDSLEFLFVFEDVSKFHTEGMATDQRIDLLVKALMSHCPKVRVLLTLGLEPDFEVFTHLRDVSMRVTKIEGMNEKEMKELFLEKLQMAEATMRVLKDTSDEDIQRYCKQCNGLPVLVLSAVRSLAQLSKRGVKASNRRKMVIEDDLKPELRRLKKHRYYLREGGDTLHFGDLSAKLKRPDAREFWARHFPSATRGSWIEVRDFLKVRYNKTLKGRQQIKRPLQIEFPGFPEHEFITQELLPFMAKQTKTKYTVPTDEIAIDTPTGGGSMLSPRKKKKKKKAFFKRIGKSGRSPRLGAVDAAITAGLYGASGKGTAAGSRSSSEIAIELFGELCHWWNKFLTVITDSAVEPYYFTDPPHIVAGLMSNEKTKEALRQRDIPIGTAIFRFSTSRPGALVVELKKGVGKKGTVKYSKHIIHVNPSQQKTLFEFQKDSVRSEAVSSLFDVVRGFHKITGVWSVDRSNVPTVVMRSEVLEKLRPRSVARGSG